MMEDFYRITQELWHVYFSGTGSKDAADQLISTWFDPACTIIGTGKHEIYKTVEDFRAALYRESEEERELPCHFQDFWCHPSMLADDLCLVHGGICICFGNEAKGIEINMDSRFSIVFVRRESGWKIIHFHHSRPNIEQVDDEYYPKTLLQQYHVNNEKIKHLKILAERDGLTNLINFRTLQERYQGYIDTHASCWLFIIDVDKFKDINDTYGHVAGNRVLQKIAMTLTHAVRASDIVCRMGGDEFILLCDGFETDENADSFVTRLKSVIASAGQGETPWIKISIGKAKTSAHDTFEEVIQVADTDLYRDKGRRAGTPERAHI